MPKRLTTKEFILRSITKHGDRYDYSLSNYVKNSVKVKIICKIHGIFEQKPIYHMDNHGCPQCGIDKRVNERKLTKKEFIKRGNEIHNYKYDYSKFICDTIFKKSIIICGDHGEFLQNPNDHLLSKAGCPECAGNKKLTNETFISLAREKHGNRYDYSLVEYKGNKKKVKIICKNHGIFLQRPNDHMAQSNGCPYCPVNVSNGEKEVIEYIKSFYGGEIITQEMSLIHPFHLDIYLPEINLGIEYNGNYFHSMNINPDKNYMGHQKKFLICKEKNIDLIQIFEDEWKDKTKEIKKYLYNRINNLDNLTGNIMNNRFPNHKLYEMNGYKEVYISKPLVYDNKEFLIYDAGRTVWERKD